MPSVLPVSPYVHFDVSRHILLVPTFRENEVDTYFFRGHSSHFKVSEKYLAFIVKCKLIGKAQEVCSALTIEQSLDYDIVKAAMLRAY